MTLGSVGAAILVLSHPTCVRREISLVKGFVPTPPQLVDKMVEKLFRTRPPRADDSLLDPGCGTGAFIRGVIRWCEKHGQPIPRITGVDSDPALLAISRRDLDRVAQVTLLEEDFLTTRRERYNYVIGNPPYVPITGLTVDERTRYRQEFLTARGRFDLYLLFFEQALKVLRPSGRLVFITPEKFLYVRTAGPLRKRLGRIAVEEIELVTESTFGDLITYPTITTVDGDARPADTLVRLRDGSTRAVRLTPTDTSWLPLINGVTEAAQGSALGDACVRISCGVATGADDVFVLDDFEMHASLRRYAFPTISGRTIEIGGQIITSQSMLVPYAPTGTLIPEKDLGALEKYLRAPARYAQLMRRTCVLRKPWYAFHENPPLGDILRPKILCKDISSRPWFVVDESGLIVPRHSVYYLVPANGSQIHELCDYLNSDEAAAWLMAHCQRAANGFVRLQSHVLRELPVPARFLSDAQLTFENEQLVGA